ncbi:MAG: riboflavin synthase [Deltaproteobacteria bacterium]|nr:riboflavin synthase [Deltaproteobacteria bacterium]
MFTGLVESRGKIISSKRGGKSAEIEIEGGGRSARWVPGASVAVNGVCLTVVESRGRRFRTQVGPVTFQDTNLGELRVGNCVNLERPVTWGKELGGHWVQGHVDGVGIVRSLRKEGEAWRLEVGLPVGLRRYCVQKGSIAVDGISLTIAETYSDGVSLMIIPYTWEKTNLQSRKRGDRLNIEVDILAKYVEGLVGQKEG